MFKKSFSLLGVLFVAALHVQAPRTVEPFWDAAFSGPAGAPLNEDDAKSWQNLADLSQKHIALKATKHIRTADPKFEAFLNSFVAHPEVASLLASRSEIVYRDRPTDKGLSEDEVATIRAWLISFNDVVEKFGGRLLTEFSDKNLPVTIEVKFPTETGLRPQGYKVKLLCRNGWRLGFYSDAGKDCIRFNCHAFSPFPFPLQMISSLFYEDLARSLGAPFLRVARSYLFPLPETETLPLDDWDVFVVEEDFVVPANQQRQAVNAMIKIKDFPDFIRNTRGFSFKSPSNYFFRKDGAQMVLRDFERPALGGNPAYLFLEENWAHNLTSHMNSACGVVSLFKSFFKGLGLDARIEEIFGAAIDEGPYSDDESEAGDAAEGSAGGACGGSRRG